MGVCENVIPSFFLFYFRSSFSLIALLIIIKLVVCCLFPSLISPSSTSSQRTYVVSEKQPRPTPKPTEKKKLTVGQRGKEKRWGDRSIYGFYIVFLFLVFFFCFLGPRTRTQTKQNKTKTFVSMNSYDKMGFTENIPYLSPLNLLSVYLLIY